MFWMNSEQAKSSQTLYEGGASTTFKNHGEDGLFIFKGVFNLHNAVLSCEKKANRVSI